VFEASAVVVIGVALWMMAGVALLGKLVHSFYVRHRKGIDVPHYEGPLVGAVVSLTIVPLVYLLSGKHNTWVVAIPTVFGGVCLFAWLSGRVLTRQGRERAAAISFREKSALIVLLTNVIVFGLYFWKTRDATLAQAVPVFFKTIGLAISVLIASHILAAVHSRKEDIDAAADERDKLIDLFSTRNAHYILLIGAWLIPVLAILPMDPLVVANSALAVLVASAIVMHGSQIWYYRLGL
jgi:hypothetical protein